MPKGVAKGTQLFLLPTWAFIPPAFSRDNRQDTGAGTAQRRASPNLHDTKGGAGREEHVLESRATPRQVVPAVRMKRKPFVPASGLRTTPQGPFDFRFPFSLALEVFPHPFISHVAPYCIAAATRRASTQGEAHACLGAFRARLTLLFHELVPVQRRTRRAVLGRGFPFITPLPDPALAQGADAPIADAPLTSNLSLLGTTG